MADENITEPSIDPSTVYKCMQCQNDIGLIADLENHDCFDGKSISITCDGAAYINEPVIEVDDYNGAASSSNSFHWQNVAVFKLIHLWQAKSASEKGKGLWKSLADALRTTTFHPSWEQVENKWKGLQRAHKKVNRRKKDGSGRRSQIWIFANAMDDALKSRTPISKASSSKGFQTSTVAKREISDDDEEESDEPSPKPKRRHITTEAEEWVEVEPMLHSQERRHKERMDGHGKMCTILENYMVDPLSDCDNDGAAPPVTWSRESVLKLIELWKFKKSFVRGKDLWTSFVKELRTPTFQPTWEQIENKLKGLRRTHSKIVTSGGSRNWTFFNAVDDAVNYRPKLIDANTSTGFRITLSETTGFQRSTVETAEMSDDSEDSPSPPKRQQTAPKSNTPEWVAQLLRSQERRHRERMAGHSRMCSILEKYLEKL